MSKRELGCAGSMVRNHRDQTVTSSLANHVPYTTSFSCLMEQL
jgi:hypothetical protein